MAIVTEAFAVTARAMAAQCRRPEYPFLVMPHPTANLTAAELDQRVQDLMPAIVQFLLDRPV